MAKPAVFVLGRQRLSSARMRPLPLRVARRGPRAFGITILRQGLAVACALSGCNLDAQSWQPLPEVRGVPRQATATEPDGSTLEARGHELVRIRGSSATTLRCTDPAGTGTVHAVAAGPFGMTFVAAERGVFLLHPSVEVLDPLELGEGSPPGTPVGVHSDRADRLWILTSQAFGCVKVGQWFGCTQTAEDGLPPGPYLGLGADAEGLLVQTAAGTWRYRPNPASPEIARAEPRQAVGADGVVTLHLATKTADRVLWRWRMATHHVLRAVAQDTLHLTHPGKAELVIVAFDRDLDGSTPQALRVQVPYAKVYSKSVLLPALGLPLLAIMTAMLVWARRQRAPWGRALLHAGLLGAVILQLVGVAFDHGRSYPLLGFSMYTEVYQHNQVLYTPAFLGQRPDGSWHPTSAGPLSYNTEGNWRHLAEYWFADDAERQRLLDQRSAAGDGPWVGFELRVQRCRLTTAGPIEAAPWVVARHPSNRQGR